MNAILQASKKVLSNYNQTVAATLSDPPHISFIEGSFLDDSNDHFDADVVFANSTCFSNELMIDIAKRADKMRLGSRFISFTVKLPSPCFRVSSPCSYSSSSLHMCVLPGCF